MLMLVLKINNYLIYIIHMFLTQCAFDIILNYKKKLGSSRASSPTHTKSNTLELTSGANHHDNQHQQPHHNGTCLLIFKHACCILT